MRRRATPIVLVVLASIIGLVSIFALWAKRQLLETDTWKETSTALIADDTIRNAVADYAVAELFANVDVQAILDQRLTPVAPRLAAPLSGVLTGGIHQLAGDAAHRILDEPKVQQVWVDVTSAAQQKIIALLEDKGQFVATTGGTVTLDLSGVVAAIAQQTGLPDLSSKLPPGTAQLEIMRSDELAAAQDGLQIFKTLAWVLTAITLALYGIAVAIARGRRRETLRSVGISFVVVGALVLFADQLAGTAVTDSLAASSTAEPAIQNAWDIGTSLLRETAQSIILYGVVIVIAAWIAGPSRFATTLRDTIAPYFRRPAVAYGSLAAVLALIFWWDPTVGTHRLVPSLIMVALLAFGFEMLRRQLIREFPDRVSTASAEGIAHDIAERMRQSRQRRVAQSVPAPAAAPAQDPRVDALERLAKLKQSGVLDEDEFAAEKRRILEPA